MPSQLELLRESLARLQPEFGPDSPFVKTLKERIVGMENQLYRREQRTIKALKPPHKSADPNPKINDL
jgi:capsule polysaccharide export protein KpsE/RkpR